MYALRRRPALLVLVATALLAAFLRLPGSGSRHADACAIATTPRVYEPQDYRAQYSFLMELAAYDLLFPGDNEFGRQVLEQGPRSARLAVSPGHIPPVLLQSIGYIESAWQMASSIVPYGGSGPGLVASDCGYGIMQVTSGMTVPLGADGRSPSPVQALTGTHYAYNIARGTAILANKWNDGGDIRPIVGDGNPDNLESWYFAVWGYNGFVLLNHPFSERFQSAVRIPYSCNATDSLGHDRSQYPYQELVYGCAQNPPVRDGAPLWPPQQVGLPNLLDPAVSDALDTENFVFPYDKMDLPQPATMTRDPSSPPLTTGRDALLAQPTLQVAAPQISATVVEGDPVPTLPSVILRNAGTGVGSWMVRSSAPWLATDLVAGVVLAANVPCVSETSFCDREVAVVPVVNVGALQPGENLASLTFIDPRTPTQTFEVAVRIVLTEPGQTEVHTRALASGCNAVGVGFPSGTPVQQLVAAVQPPDSIVAMWRLPSPGSPFELFLPGQPAVSTLDDVTADEGLFICTSASASFEQTVQVGGPPRTATLSQGCSFVGVSQDGSAATFAAGVQPPSAVSVLWRFDTPSNTWLLHLPGVAGASTLDQVRRVDGLFVCVNGPASVTQPGLAPG